MASKEIVHFFLCDFTGLQCLQFIICAVPPLCVLKDGGLCCGRESTHSKMGGFSLTLSLSLPTYLVEELLGQVPWWGETVRVLL